MSQRPTHGALVSPGIRTLAAATALVLLPALSACLGDVSNDGTNENGGTNEHEGVNESIEAICGETPSGRVVARRLSKLEYNNTLRDLFGFDVGNPSEGFPDDVTGVNGLTVSDLFLERHEDVATRLAASAVEQGFVKCDPTAMDPRLCARQILEPFMRRAWRGPVAPEEVDDVVAYLDVVAAEASEVDPFRQAIRLAIQDILMSPTFLFRFEPVGDPTSPLAQPLSGYELASRLSYFIYDSMPDAPLFAAAESGELTKPEKLEAQVERMLADPKGAALLNKLAGGWLATDKVDLVNPKATLYPSFDAEMRQSLKQETALFVKEFLGQDRSFRDMFDADFTYVNRRLAGHYGFPGADGFTSDFTRVSLAALPQRGGLLTQGAILAATSAPINIPTAEVSETNVVVRGRFVLKNLLCADLPPTPADLDVNQIQADAQKDIPATAPRKVREGVRQTRAPCLGCHSFMDPIGFSMEHFDVTGAWRDVDTLNTAVDSTGVLKGADGSFAGQFDGARSIGALIKKDPRLSGCLTQTVLKMAAGRALTEYDQCRVRALAEWSDKKGNGLRDLVHSLTQSRSFTHQQGEVP